MPNTPQEPHKIYTGNAQDFAGFPLPKGAAQIQIGVKKHRDDCPKNAFIYHLVHDEVWVFIDVIMQKTGERL